MGARRAPGELVVTLPGEKKLKTVVSLLVRDRTPSVSAFVIRNPDENHEAFYRYLLRRNLRLHGVAYAIDTDGDVYLPGGCPRPRWTRSTSTSSSGSSSTRPTASFNELLALGFLELDAARSGPGGSRAASPRATSTPSATCWTTARIRR